MSARLDGRLAIALTVWRQALGLPYRWGGDDPMTGFDCSGLVLEGLKACGLFAADRDDTADGLRRRYPSVRPAELAPGCLLFWGDHDRATHVEIVWVVDGGMVFTLGASGGGRRTTDVAAAAAQNAYVKIRPARSGWIAAVDPFAVVLHAA